MADRLVSAGGLRAVDDAVGLIDLLGGFDDAALMALPAPQRDALRVALLRADAEQPSATPDQRALSVAVASLLRDAAQSETPLLMAIDDLQFLDESTAAILTYALRRLADRPIRLLATIRTGAETSASRDVLAALPPDRVETVPVGPMHLGSLHRLFQFGSAGHSRGWRSSESRRRRSATPSTRWSWRGRSPGRATRRSRRASCRFRTTSAP